MRKKMRVNASVRRRTCVKASVKPVCGCVCVSKVFSIKPFVCRSFCLQAFLFVKDLRVEAPVRQSSCA